MVCINKRRQNGCGVIDTVMKTFTAERYPGERHAYSLASATFGKSMSFMGPGTRLDLRLNQNETPKANSQPLNSADFHSFQHDLAYKHAKDDYMRNPTPENKRKQINKVWRADDKFINDMNHDYEEPMAPIAGKLIKAKRLGEQVGILPTTTFSGFGTSEEEIIDPVAKLRELAKKEYKVEKHS